MTHQTDPPGRSRLRLVVTAMVIGWAAHSFSPVWAQALPGSTDTCTVCDPLTCPQCPDCSTVCDPSTCPPPTCPDCSSMCDPSTCPSCTVQTTILACRHVVQNADGSIVGSHCTVQVGVVPGSGN